MAAQKVLLGEITRARQCLTAPLAPGNDNTLKELQRKRPQQVVRELPEHVRAFVPETSLVVNKEILLKSLMSSPRGSSPGSGGCTYEHLKMLMDDVDTFELLHEAGCSLRRLTDRTLAQQSPRISSPNVTGFSTRCAPERALRRPFFHLCCCRIQHLQHTIGTTTMDSGQ